MSDELSSPATTTTVFPSLEDLTTPGVDDICPESTGWILASQICLAVVMCGSMIFSISLLILIRSNAKRCRDILNSDRNDQVFVIQDDYVHDLENDQCLLPASELTHLTMVSEGGTGHATPNGGVSDFYDIAPPVYELNPSAAAAMHAAERRRTRSGDGQLSGRLSSPFLNGRSSVITPVMMANRNSSSALSVSHHSNGGRMGSMASHHGNYLGVPEMHQRLYRTRSQELVDQLTRLVLSDQDMSPVFGGGGLPSHASIDRRESGFSSGSHYTTLTSRAGGGGGGYGSSRKLSLIDDLHRLSADGGGSSSSHRDSYGHSLHPGGMQVGQLSPAPSPKTSPFRFQDKQQQQGGSPPQRKRRFIKTKSTLDMSRGLNSNSDADSGLVMGGYGNDGVENTYSKMGAVTSRIKKMSRAHLFEDQLDSKRSSLTSVVSSPHYRIANSPKISVVSHHSEDGTAATSNPFDEELASEAVRAPYKKLSAELSELLSQGFAPKAPQSSSDNLVLYRRQRRPGITFGEGPLGGGGLAGRDSMA